MQHTNGNKEYHRVGEPYYKKSKRFKSQRIQGDSIYFFIFHNIISMFIFFIISVSIGLYNESTQLLSDLASWVFMEGLLVIFGLMLISGIIGRIVAYITIKVIVNHLAHRETKKLGEFLRGINGISLSYFFSTFISASLFALGALAIIQTKIFGQSNLWTLVLTYTIVKTLVYLTTRLFSAWKL